MEKSHRMTFDLKNANGFTLAEVLITLAVLGIISAIILPQLITNHKKKETVVRLKKAYSVVQQILTASQADNGDIETWDVPSDGYDFFETYIKNYVQYTQEYSSSELWKIAPRKLLNGNNYNGTTYGSSSKTSSHFLINDGTLITLNNHSSNGYIWVGIDTNGLSNPNQIGKDTFLFMFTTEYGLQPFGGNGTPAGWSYGDYSRDTVLSTKNNACNKQASLDSGYWCTALIINDDWKIKDDYPW